MCLIEFAERASYYGSIGPFNNFINRPLPLGGNGAGAVAPGAAGLNQSAGALGMGSVAATGIVQMFTFLVSFCVTASVQD
jgi:POT family proton-dependent oligopeptide transporter